MSKQFTSILALTVTAGAALQVDASGRVIDKVAGATVARLLPGQVAAAAGVFVEVLLIPN